MIVSPLHIDWPPEICDICMSLQIYIINVYISLHICICIILTVCMYMNINF